MENFVLKILDLFSWMYRILRVDYDQLRAIVATKLMMDNRRQTIAYNKKKAKEPGNAFVLTLLFYGIFGTFVAVALYRIPSFMLSMVVFFSYITVMIAMTLITDFSAILLDTSDNTIILPRPVDGRTLFVARVTHILLYLGQLALGLSIAPAVAVGLLYGWPLVFLLFVTIILSVFTAVFLTNAIYLLILQFSTEEKLKNIINYFQIGMAIAIMGGYQILPRILERLDLQTYIFEIQWWNYLIPPVWMAGTMEAVHFGIWDSAHVGLVTCALAIPPLLAYVVNRYLTPIFNRKLGSLGSGVEQVEKQRQEKGSWTDNISRWITFTPFEKGAFDIMFKMLGRDRKIKLKVYPSYGYILVFGFIFVLRGKEDFSTTWTNLPSSEYHIALLYLSFMILQVALHEIPYTDDFKASWIYFSTPLDKPGEILSGTLKAVFVRLFVPGYIGVSIFILLIWGIHALGDIAFGLLNNFLMVIILVSVSKRFLPFSMAPSVRNQTGNFVRSMLSLLIIGILGFGHYLITKKPLIMTAIVPVQLGLTWILYRQYKQTRWKEISL